MQGLCWTTPEDGPCPCTCLLPFRAHRMLPSLVATAGSLNLVCSHSAPILTHPLRSKLRAACLVCAVIQEVHNRPTHSASIIAISLLLPNDTSRTSATIVSSRIDRQGPQPLSKATALPLNTQIQQWRPQTRPSSRRKWMPRPTAALSPSSPYVSPSVLPFNHSKAEMFKELTRNPGCRTRS